MDSQDTATMESAEPKLSQRERVYRDLRAALMDGSLKAWDRLNEVRLAERFKASRTPVREALARLESDGLVRRRDGGYYLYVPSFDDLVALYELRITLELQGIRRAIDDPMLGHVRAIIEDELQIWYALREERPAPDASFVCMDEGFHTALLRSSGNRALTDALVTVNRQIRPVRMYDYLTEDRMRATVDEHIDIAEKVVSGRLQAAFDALHNHVGASRDVVIQRASLAMTMATMAATTPDDGQGR
jgi:DNA-binding GntR family transcriptional regulator